MGTALMLVDIQNDYFPDGKMALHQPEIAAANASKLLDWFRKNNGDSIFHVQHLANTPAAVFFLPNTEGAEIHAAVQPLENEIVVVKHASNCFLRTDLESRLKEKGVTKLIIAGMMTHMCIDAAAPAAADSGYEITLIEDACATRELTF